MVNMVSNNVTNIIGLEIGSNIVYRGEKWHICNGYTKSYRITNGIDYAYIRDTDVGREFVPDVA
jgi:hypothetical protein